MLAAIKTHKCRDNHQLNMNESGANVPAMMDIISSGNGLSIVQRKALVYTNADTLSTGPLGESGLKTACISFD